MNAGFIKRAFSTLVDITIIMVIVYLTFIIGGRILLRNQVADFDEIFAAYNEVSDAYEASRNVLLEEYDAAVILADGDDTLEAEALAAYNADKVILDEQYYVDIEPYDDPMTGYYINVFFYFAIGLVVLMSIYTVVLNGRTLGRRLSQLKLEGKVNPISIFFHDIIFKYFPIVLLSAISLGVAIIVLIVSILIDFFMMSFTAKKLTIRDLLFGVLVVKAGYGY
jgi:hypothetical protein